MGFREKGVERWGKGDEAMGRGGLVEGKETRGQELKMEGPE